jgi:hydroxyethylthiazole kinase-like uncharacterized protein yjeF
MHFDLCVLDANQTYLADGLCIKSGISGEQLMENAGIQVANFIVQKFEPSLVYIFCGSGNNGGDGFVIARILKDKGFEVKLFEVLETSAKDNAFLAKYKWKESGGAISLFNDKIEDKCKIIVDAIFGIGLKDSLPDNIKKIIKIINAHKAKKIAIDIPTGINASTGEIFGSCINADYTISFFKPKIGHLLLPAKKYVGELIISQIGILDDVLKQLKPYVFQNSIKLWQKFLPVFDIDVHKYQKGVSMVIAGEPNYMGAIKLSSLACLRAGSGIVSVLVDNMYLYLYSNINPSIILKEYDNFWGMSSIIGDDRITAFLIGPGLGVNEDAKKKVIEVLKTKKPVVLDADAISTFSNNPKDLFKHLHPNVVLTPHEGEFKKIFSIEGNKIERAVEAAKQTGAIVVLKGNDTVISDGNKVVINTNSNKNLATAGSGDVLAGIITGLLSQEMPAFYAACSGVWIHCEVANNFKYGLIASDIADNVALGLNKAYE